MAAIITIDDLPAAVSANELVDTMLAGANAKAARVAPCLVEPTTTSWVTATAYAVGDRVKIATNQYLEATVAGTSSATTPTAPAVIGDTVADGDVTWKRIAPTTEQLAEAKLVLVGAMKRWVEAGAGALQSQTVGPFGMTVDTRQRSSGFNLWPSEINQLQEICQSNTTGSSGAFSFSPSGAASAHLPWCSLNFGATYCSCGVDIAGYPIYELDTDTY